MPNIDRSRTEPKNLGSLLELLGDGIERATDHAWMRCTDKHNTGNRHGERKENAPGDREKKIACNRAEHVLNYQSCEK